MFDVIFHFTVLHLFFIIFFSPIISLYLFIIILNSESCGALFRGWEVIMHYTGLLSQSFTKKLLKKKALYFLIIKIKRKKDFFLSPLTKGQCVRPPNIPINNHLNIVLLVSHFNLTDIGHHCCKKKRKEEKATYRWTKVTFLIQLFF